MRLTHAQRAFDRLEGFPARHRALLGDLESFPSPGHRRLHGAAASVLRSDHGGAIALLGPRGVGKTSEATRLAYEWVRDALERWLGLPTDFRAPRAVYRTLTELLNAEKSMFDSPQHGIATPLDLAATAPLFVLDEIHEAPVHDTTWSRQQFVTLLDRRYRDRRPTILLGNLSEKGVRGISESVWDRIREGGGFFDYSGMGSLRGNPIRPLP